MNERELFVAAMHLRDKARIAFLDLACHDPAQRARIESLLIEHDQLGSFLESSSGAPVVATVGHIAEPEAAATTDVPGDDLGRVIAGKYKLIERIGEGGMGSVYMAQQSVPVKRFVAVKVIKAGMDSKAVLARFEAERQALAIMDHPNIAKILDGGVTDTGAPFFVMELVKGTPITAYCDARKLTPKERLELFIPVCHAIQHAHQKGIIHRDIKPSNVLIALYDDRAVPKVIDFGIAKATGQALTDSSYHTAFGGIVGTPEYMSPEQASLNNLDIDTRSDVYSLGVLLYELLAGSPPFRSDDLKRAGILEMLRVVREEEPPRPSNKLSTAATRPSISANRGTDPHKLTGLLRNELDWIVMKALAKDRARRYDSANGFAADVQRYLTGEAVQAHPPTLGYRLLKVLRRNKTTVRVASAFLCMGLGAIAMGAYLAVQAIRAEKVAEERRMEAEANAERADRNAAESQKNAELLKRESGINFDNTIEAILKAESLQIDLDLSEMRIDPRVGILRLAGPHKQNLQDQFEMIGQDGNKFDLSNSSFEDTKAQNKELRQFVTMAVLAAGQDFAPLLPLMSHDGREIVFQTISPDGQRLLTLGEDGTARLWNSRTAGEIAVLRKTNGRVINCGFNPDGRTIYTLDIDRSLQFWNTDNGQLQANTEIQKERFEYPAGLTVQQLKSISDSATRIRCTNNRVLIQTQPVHISNNYRPDDDLFHDGPSLPAELWDTGTGRSIRRYDTPGIEVTNFHFSPQGHWLSAIEGKHQAVIYSPSNGSEVARVLVPENETLTGIQFSPNDHWIITTSYNTPPGQQSDWHYRLWQSDSWKQVADQFPNGAYRGSSFLNDDHFLLDDLVYPIGRQGAIVPVDASAVARLGGSLLLTRHDRLYDARTWKKLLPHSGRKYHPAFAQLSYDGRFVFDRRNTTDSLNHLTDTVTEKQIQLKWDYPGEKPCFVTGIGYMAFDGSERRVLPSSKYLDIPRRMLELWAQVAVRGELGPEGEFVPWNEATWETKRQQLAAMPVPYPDFPFPGYLATDKLHWLRAEFRAAKTIAEQVRIARELLARCELEQNRTEAIRWRTALGRLVPEVAPAPRVSRQ